MTSIKSLLRLALVAVGLLFSTAAFALCGTGSGTCYWVGGGSSTNWSATSNTNWSLVSGGANNAGPPVTGDTVVFDANSGTGTSNISASTSINQFLGSTSSAITLTTGGSLTLTVTGTVFTLGSGIAYTAANANRAITFNPGVGNTVVITTNGQTLGNTTCSSGTCTLATNLAGLSSATLTVPSGAVLDAATDNPNVTFGYVSANTGTRTFNCGTGTWTLTGISGTSWDFSTVNTGLTASCGSGTLDFTTTATAPITFNTGAQTFGTVNVNVGSSAYWFNIVPGLTATALNATAPFTLALTEPDTYAITNAFTWTGGSSSAQSAVICRNCVAAASVTTISSAATNTATWLAIQGVTFSGGGSFTATNSFNLGGNTGITITSPSGGSSATGKIFP